MSTICDHGASRCAVCSPRLIGKATQPDDVHTNSGPGSSYGLPWGAAIPTEQYPPRKVRIGTQYFEPRYTSAHPPAGGWDASPVPQGDWSDFDHAAARLSSRWADYFRAAAFATTTYLDPEITFDVADAVRGRTWGRSYRAAPFGLSDDLVPVCLHGHAGPHFVHAEDAEALAHIWLDDVDVIEWCEGVIEGG